MFTPQAIRAHIFRVAIFVCVVMSVCCAWEAVTITSEPRVALVASPCDFHLGVVRQGEVIGADFALQNTASFPIEIVAIRSTCACTSYSIPKMSLEPGEVVPLTMKIDTKYRRESVVASCFVEYCTPQQQNRPAQLAVQLSADIDPDFDVAPIDLKFRKGERAIREVSVVPRHVESVTVTKAECDRECFSATVENAAQAVKSVSVAYDPLRDYPDNAVGTLKIHTDSINQPVICVKLSLE
jgi:hypothetical protein